MKNRSPGFTLIELLTVMAIIVILAGLVLGTSGYVQKKGARSRAEAEIAALSAALESYKADNGIYPRVTAVTDSLYAGPPASANFNPTSGTGYSNASRVLYRALSGDTNCDRAVSSTDQNFNIDGSAATPPLASIPKTYFEFKPGMLQPTGGTGTVTAIIDPFGNSYGYSTANQADNTKGYNPTFDLWSTGGQTTATGSGQWLKNW